MNDDTLYNFTQINSMNTNNRNNNHLFSAMSSSNFSNQTTGLKSSRKNRYKIGGGS